MNYPTPAGARRRRWFNKQRAQLAISVRSHRYNFYLKQLHTLSKKKKKLYLIAMVELNDGNSENSTNSV